MNKKISKKITKGIAPSTPKTKEPTQYTIEQVTHPKKKIFLQHFYAIDGNVTKAVNAAKIHRRLFYYWMDTDPAFNYLITEQRQQLLDDMDERLKARAKGKHGTTELIFWLKTHHPEYKQNETIAYQDSSGSKFILTRGK